MKDHDEMRVVDKAQSCQFLDDGDVAVRFALKALSTCGAKIPQGTAR